MIISFNYGKNVSTWVLDFLFSLKNNGFFSVFNGHVGYASFLNSSLLLMTATLLWVVLYRSLLVEATELFLWLSSPPK